MNTAFQQCFSKLPEATLLVSAQGVILEANLAAAELLSRALLKGAILGELVFDSPEKVNRYLKLCRRTRDLSPGGLTFKNENPNGISCRIDGALFEATPEGGLLILRLSSKGEATRAFRTLNEQIDALNREVTERKRSEALLYAQQEWLRATLLSIGDAVIATDANSKITFLNGVAQSLTGWTQEEAAGKTLDKIFVITNEETGATVEDPVSKALRERRVVGLANHTKLTAKDGREIPIDDSAAPIRDANGNVTGVVLVFRSISERKAAEAALREQDRQLHSMVDSIDQLAWMANADGWIYWYNKRWYEYTGTTPAQMEGWGWQSVHDPKVLPDVMAKWTTSIRTGESFDMIFPLKGADGVFRPFLTRINPVRDNEGAVIRWFGTNTDVDALSEAEASVRKAEERFRTAVAAVSDLLWTNNAKGEMEGDQPGWGGFTGQSREEYQGYGWARAVHPDDAQPTIKEWQRAVAERRKFVFEHRVRRHDGAWRLFSLCALPVIDAAGEIQEWVGVHTDITDRKQAEQALCESEERFRALADNIPQLAWIADAGTDGQVHWFNENWFRYTGTTLEEMKGSGWHKVQHPDYAERVIQKFAHHVQANLDWEDTFPLRGKDGTYRWFLSRMKCIRDEFGNVARIFGTNTDITEQLEIQQQLARANQDLESFAYSASHDLQEPLRMVTSYSQMLVNGYKGRLDGEAEMYVNFITDGTRRMRELLNDLLAYTAVDVKTTDDTETIDLNVIFQEVSQNSQVAIEESGAVITSRVLKKSLGALRVET